MGIAHAYSRRPTFPGQPFYTSEVCSMSNTYPGDTISHNFKLRTSANVLSDADELPTGKVYRNGVYDAAVTVTITNNTTGDYKFSATTPSTYAGGDVVQVEVSATVDSETDSEYVFATVLGEPLGLEFTVDDTTVTPTTTTFAFDSSAPSTDDVLIGGYVVFLSGANKGLPPIPIDDYTGSTRAATFAAEWPTAPSDGDRGLVIGKSS